MASPLTYAPFVLAPPLTTCDTAYLTFGQGSAPYVLNIISTGDSNGTSLEQLPVQGSAGVFKWRVDFNEGANITFALTDGKGATAYSQYRVVQADLITGRTTCGSKNDYTSGSSHSGAIAGGVVGGLALLAIVCGLLFWRHRQLKRNNPFFSSGRKHATDEDDDMRLANGASVVRAGTFNLGQVRFTEASLDHLRAIDRPPGYHEAGDAPPSASATAVEPASVAAAATAAGGASEGEETQSRLPPPVPQQRRSRVREEQERRDREYAERVAREDEIDGIDDETASTVLARSNA